MCPSYMVTREEKHTTRGRARILWEMVNHGDLELWRSDEVLDALDLCLSCKGCTKDCPVSVDMPTLKAEFLSHHYQGRRRPRHAYAFGLIDQAARLASHAPRLANALAPLTKPLIGVHPERHLPDFAPLTLRDWYARRGTHNPAGKKVILWADTFTNHFHTDVGVAAVEALEDAGCNVVIPQGHLCCGRPLYDYEKLDSGCCGMAGAWGYEHAHYDVSMACGERVLLPKVREASTETLLVTAGFSCRSQIEQATDRRALHIAQVIQLARDHGASGPSGPYPERAAARKPQPVRRSRRRVAVALAGVGAVAAAAGSAVAARK